MVVRPKPGQNLTRWTYLKIAVRGARCGLLSAGEHSWGPLVADYEGARHRRQHCRWCRASRTPASEIERDPLTEEERERWKAMFVKPTEEDAARALEILRKRGIYRDGKMLWD